MTQKKKFTRCARLARNSLVLLTALGAVLGIALGFGIRATDPSEDAITLVMFPGELFMRMLKMLIIPVIITSVVSGLVALDVKKMGKIGLHAVIYYVTTSILATILGIVLVVAIHPGRPDHKHSGNVPVTVDVSILDSFLDLLRNLLPENIITACFEISRTEVIPGSHADNAGVRGSGGGVGPNLTGLAENSTSFIGLPASSENNTKVLNSVRGTNILGLICFFIAFGVTLSGLGEETRVVANLFVGLNKILMKMIGVGIWVSPVGICSLIAGNILKMKSVDTVIQTIGMYMVTIILGNLVHGIIVLPLVFWILTRKNPYKYAVGVGQALLTAFATTSSAATLPITTRNLEDNLHIDKRITRFLLPIGATVNMDASAMMQAVALITVAQMYQVPLSFGRLITISLTATAVSIGAAAVPGADMSAFVLILSTFGLPTEVAGVFWSIDWFLGKIRAVVNVFGDCIGAGVIQHLHHSSLNSLAQKREDSAGNEEIDDVVEETSLISPSA